MNKLAQARLLHVLRDSVAIFNSSERIQDIQGRILNMQHNYIDLFYLLKGNAEANGIASYFSDHDLPAFKNWFYNYGRLWTVCAQPPWSSVDYTEYGGYRVLNSVFYLLSDCEPLIQWYAYFDISYMKSEDYNDIDNVEHTGYWTKQLFLAMRGDWDVLRARCEHVLAHPPTNDNVMFQVDHRFYLALANGDQQGMEAVIRELVSEPLVSNKKRNDLLEGGYSRDLYCTPAVIYSKLAWRHGYEVVVDSPLIPKEWLPIAPLTHYEDVFEFMKDYPL
jgi:Immunity protein 49